MGIAQSPRIVKDGLVFHFDAQSPKSYTGPVITNQFAVPTPAENGAVTFAVQGTGTFYRVPAGEVHGGYKVGEDDVIYRYDLGGTGCHYHGNDATMTSGQYATWQFDYYISKSVTAFPTVNYLANMENIGAGTGGAVTVAGPTIGAAGNWRSIRYTVGPATATGDLRPLLYPGACSSSYLASAGYILYRNPAVWYTSFVPTANLPYVSGSRSNTQAFKDLTGQSTITASTGVSYDSDGTFNFPSDDTGYLDAPATRSASYVTISAWVKVGAHANFNRFVNNNWTGNGWLLYSTVTNWAFGVAQNNSQTNAVGAHSSSTAWTNLVGVYDGSNVRLYVNGTQVSSPSLASATLTTSGNIRIGQSAEGTNYIDNVKMYNRALSAEEVVQNFNALRGRYGI